MNVDALYKKADKIADNLGYPIDEGIKKTVVGLWAHGICTTGSCEGHADHGEPFPWVDIELEEPKEWQSDSKAMKEWKKANLAQAAKVQELLNTFNKNTVYPAPLIMVARGQFGARRLQTGRTKSITDTIPPKFLKELQSQVNDFADFLLEEANKPPKP